jgi:hypothetical protein
MTNRRAILTHDTLFERICNEFEEDATCPTEEQFNEVMYALCDENEYLERHPLDDDEVGYMARADLKWKDFQDLACAIKKQILLYLVDNPKTFCILLNTQKGKTVIIAKHLAEWTQQNTSTPSKIVPFVFMMNDRTLGDQTQESLLQVPNAKIFQLSSNAKTSETEIMTYMDAWASDTYGDYLTPIILTLPNANQMQKVARLLDRIKTRVLTRASSLRYSFVIDEYDQVYPLIRNQLLPYIGCDQALHKLGFVSATDGDTLDDYPECANAYFESHREDSPDYRAFHHADSVVKLVARAPKKHNAFAYKVIEDNASHFAKPVKLPNGEWYYRKIIVNGDSRRESMESFARKMTEPVVTNEGTSTDGANYCITINMFGVKLFVNGRPKRSKGIRGCRLNAVLYWMYRREGLHNKPLYVIGNRKVDRGLGFHFAPRKNESGEFDPVSVEFESMEYVSLGGDGIIFTDEILGHVDRQESAAQKAGRCAGIIAQSPNYCGHVHYWTDEKTASLIRTHNEKIDRMNGLSGAYTARQADARAKSQIAQPMTPTTRNYEISETPFPTAEEAKTWISSKNLCRKVRRQNGSEETTAYTTSVYGMYKYNDPNDPNELVIANDTDATHIKYRGEVRPIMTLEDFIKSTDLGQGAKSSARIMPVKVNGVIQYMAIHKK